MYFSAAVLSHKEWYMIFQLNFAENVFQIEQNDAKLSRNGLKTLKIEN